jgi:hypothetical protein
VKWHETAEWHAFIAGSTGDERNRKIGTAKLAVGAYRRLLADQVRKQVRSPYGSPPEGLVWYEAVDAVLALLEADL